jgi:hypothetical protein
MLKIYLQEFYSPRECSSELYKYFIYETAAQKKKEQM